MDVYLENLSRLLPKTGQTISNRTGDDGDLEAGWWQGRLNVNNKVRLIAKTISGDDVVIDRAAGLMWVADGNAAGCNNGNELIWNNAIDYANGLDFAGFTDWRLPNIKELVSLVNYSIINPVLEQPPFANTKNDNYWTSTTVATQAGWVIALSFGSGAYNGIIKTATNYLLCVRGGV